MKKEKNILMAVLAYCGPLIILSYLVAKDDAFTKFHIKQGLTIIIIGILTSFFNMFLFFPIFMLFWLIRMSLGIFMLIGVLNALQGKEKELPIIGQIADSFDF